MNSIVFFSGLCALALLACSESNDQTPSGSSTDDMTMLPKCEKGNGEIAEMCNGDEENHTKGFFCENTTPPKDNCIDYTSGELYEGKYVFCCLPEPQCEKGNGEIAEMCNGDEENHSEGFLCADETPPSSDCIDYSSGELYEGKVVFCCLPEPQCEKGNGEIAEMCDGDEANHSEGFLCADETPPSSDCIDYSSGELYEGKVVFCCLPEPQCEKGNGEIAEMCNGDEANHSEGFLCENTTPPADDCVDYTSGEPYEGKYVFCCTP